MKIAKKLHRFVLVPGFVCTTKFFAKNNEGISKTNRVISFDPEGRAIPQKACRDIPWRATHRTSRSCWIIWKWKTPRCLAGRCPARIVLKYHMIVSASTVSLLGLIDCPLGAMCDEE
jgi:hypothetical protein